MVGLRGEESGLLPASRTVGEAVRHVPAEVQARYPDLDWIGMRGMRNMLVQNYGAVQLDVVWGVVHGRIPLLIPRLREILDEERASPTQIADQ